MEADPQQNAGAKDEPAEAEVETVMTRRAGSSKNIAEGPAHPEDEVEATAEEARLFASHVLPRVRAEMPAFGAATAPTPGSPESASAGRSRQEAAIRNSGATPLPQGADRGPRPRQRSPSDVSAPSEAFLVFPPLTGNEAVRLRGVGKSTSFQEGPPPPLGAGCRGYSVPSNFQPTLTDRLLATERSTRAISGEGTAARWLRSVADLDPRGQILEFFNDLALEGVETFEANDSVARSSICQPNIVRAFDKCGIFSVWRPTSSDAIRKMMTGEGTGKGLDIKGKSAKQGEYSGFVPFLQIHDNAHKKQMSSMKKDERVRVFYPNKSSRDTAAATLTATGEVVWKRAGGTNEKTKRENLRKGLSVRGVSARTQRNQKMYSKKSFHLKESTVHDIDDYAATAGVYGLDIPERTFWEAYVVRNDITREKKYETGRPSMPAFQQMNIDTLREGRDMGDESECRPVLWHGGCGRRGEDAPDHCDPMCPIGLLMAYEENDKVTPVVSDFDCFLLGTRGINIHEPFRDQDLAMLSWCVDEIEGVLATPKAGTDWTARWLEVKKKNAGNPAHQGMPVFGYADPRSYSIMKGAVLKLTANGAVRHGPECFNYGFPQELDGEFLVISDTFKGLPWRYTHAAGLIDILCEKIDQGFTFPLNPKWILCDPGWKRVYGKLMKSQRPNVQESLSVWYPSIIRQRIDAISAKYPQGFVDTSDPSDQSSGVQADLALFELKRFQLRKSARTKIRFLGKLSFSMKSKK